MAFTPQDDSGTVVGANAYGSVAAFKQFHDDRGNSYGTATDPVIEQALVKATDYLDMRFRYVGMKLNKPQLTQWPRANAVDADGRWVQGVPDVVKEVTYEYALRALNGVLAPDPTRDDSGRIVMSKSEQVGPLSESVTYANFSTYDMPAYPTADRRLVRSGLTVTGGTLVRA